VARDVRTVKTAPSDKAQPDWRPGYQRRLASDDELSALAVMTEAVHGCLEIAWLTGRLNSRASRSIDKNTPGSLLCC